MTSLTAVTVADRAWTRQVPELGLWCDDREVPVNLPDTYDQWRAHSTLYDLPELAEAGKKNALDGRAALAIGHGRLVGIVSPEGALEPAVWLSIALDDIVSVKVYRRVGLTRRPHAIFIQAPDWRLLCVMVSRHDGKLEWGYQERSLLRALGGPKPRPDPMASLYTWLPRS